LRRAGVKRDVTTPAMGDYNTLPLPPEVDLTAGQRLQADFGLDARIGFAGAGRVA